MIKITIEAGRIMFDLESLIIGVILIIKKYTCIDIKIHAESNDDDYKNGIVLLPLVGLAIGFAASFISSFKIFYDDFFISAVVLSYYCIITKTVNLRDTYRTLNYIIKPKNQSEQISGTIGMIIICLFYFSLIRIVDVTAVLMMPVAGYSGLIILSMVFDRNKNGTSVIKYCDRYHSLSAFGISFALAVVINYKLVIPLSLTYMISGLVVNILDKKIKLLPNSIEGFIIEITQLIFLIFTYIFKIT
nr:hypothetical protein [Sedimentibacter sp.]